MSSNVEKTHPFVTVLKTSYPLKFSVYIDTYAIPFQANNT